MRHHLPDMANDLTTLDLKTRARWHAWLEAHHASSPGVWLVFYKDHTGRPSIAYEDAVREALCFGWIDSLIKRLDEDRFARKFTPRTPTSKWSDVNRARWRELEKAGLLQAAGRAASPTDNRYAAKPEIPELPGYIAKGLKANADAWRTFRGLPPSHRRHYVAWIHTAKRPETRQRRIAESIALLAQGKKLGLK
jgi:uncharacterized protein YdeI (YjbR/CyaY-like superfamily)